MTMLDEPAPKKLSGKSRFWEFLNRVSTSINDEKTETGIIRCYKSATYETFSHSRC